MQTSPIPISPQTSHVSFSNIEEKHQFPIEHSESKKINQQLKRELKLWDDLFVDLIQILTKAAPYPAIYIQSDEDKRLILKQLSEIVVNKAINPTESVEYQNLEKNLQDCQNKVEELKARCQQISDQLGPSPQEIPAMKEKENLDQKLTKLEEVLKRQVKNRKNELLKEKNKVHKRKKQSDQLYESSNIHKNIKSKTILDNDTSATISSSPSLKFEQLPLVKQSSQSKNKESNSHLITDIETENSNDSSS